jgi:YbbR domain-containing protein
MPRSRSLSEILWSALTSNVGTKAVSVVIALVLWAVVLGSRSVEVTKDVPLEVTTPEDLVVASDLPEKISFRLYGPKAFLRNILDRPEEPILINLSGSKPTVITYRFFTDNIRIPIGVKVLSIHPSSISIKLERMKRKEVPVRVQLQGTPPEGFKITKLGLNPEVVRIRGPESVIDRIHEIYTQPVDVSGIKQTSEKPAPLDLVDSHVQLEGDLPRIYIEMEAPSANFRIKNVDIRVISPYKSVLEEKTVTILVRAGQKDLQSIDRSQVYATVDLTGKERGKHRVPVTVNLPKNINFVKVIPEQVDVTLY